MSTAGDIKARDIVKIIQEKTFNCRPLERTGVIIMTVTNCTCLYRWPANGTDPHDIHKAQGHY
jgi:hypothetical protein